MEDKYIFWFDLGTVKHEEWQIYPDSVSLFVRSSVTMVDASNASTSENIIPAGGSTATHSKARYIISWWTYELNSTKKAT